MHFVKTLILYMYDGFFIIKHSHLQKYFYLGLQKSNTSVSVRTFGNKIGLIFYLGFILVNTVWESPNFYTCMMFIIKYLHLQKYFIYGPSIFFWRPIYEIILKQTRPFLWGLLERSKGQNKYHKANANNWCVE